MSRWKAGKPCKSMDGRDTVMRQAPLANEELHMDIFALVAFNREGVKKCGMTALFVFFDITHWLAADEEMWLITHASFSVGGVCVRFWGMGCSA